MPWYGLKIEINYFNQSICSPEKVCLYEVEFLGAFCPKYIDILILVYSYHTGCPKNWKIPWNGLKIEMNDFNYFSCSPEKVFLYEV